MKDLQGWLVDTGAKTRYIEPGGSWENCSCELDLLDRILRGEAPNYRDLSRQTGYYKRYISRVFPITFLSPNIAESRLHGVQPID